MVGSAALIGIAAANQAAVIWPVVYAAMVIPAFVLLDRYRRSVNIQYNLTESAKIISEALTTSFDVLRGSRSVWQVQNEAFTFDWKRNAGASKLNQRHKITLSFDRPSCIRGNMHLPTISLAKESLFFLPDALLVVGRRSVTALSYQDVTLSMNAVRFIEEEPTPSDTQIVGRTWRYVNKKGGPDRRFNFNKELPICLYGEIDIQSSGGLNGRIHCSNCEAAKSFARLINIVREYTRDGSQLKSITSVERAKTWPTIILSCIAVPFGGAAIAAALVTTPTLPIRANLVSPPPQLSDVPLPSARPKNEPHITGSIGQIGKPLSVPATINSPNTISGQRQVPLPRRRPHLPKT
jgi:hypothetical protein